MNKEKEKLFDICNGLHQNNNKLTRILNGEENVPDFNRPIQAKGAENHGYAGT